MTWKCLGHVDLPFNVEISGTNILLARFTSSVFTGQFLIKFWWIIISIFSIFGATNWWYSSLASCPCLNLFLVKTYILFLNVFNLLPLLLWSWYIAFSTPLFIRFYFFTASKYLLLGLYIFRPCSLNWNLTCFLSICATKSSCLEES